MADIFEVDKLLANPNARVIVALPRDAASLESLADRPSTVRNRINSVVGINLDDFIFPGSADYNNPLDSASLQTANEFFDRLKIGTAGIAEKLGFSGDKISSFTLKRVSQGLSNWTASSKPNFNIRMLVIATKPDDDVRSEYKKLLETVYPIFDGTGLTAVIRPPLGYGARAETSLDGISIKNTISVSVGQWFSAHQQIMKSVDATFSKEVHSNGTPLYAIINCNFEPALPISAQIAKGYLR